MAVNRDPLDSLSFPNQAPVIADQSFTVMEGITVIGSVTATDANRDDLTYTVSEDANGFSFDGADLIVDDASVLDYEGTNPVNVIVIVSDGEFSEQALITVNLTDDREEDFDGDGLTEAQEEDIHGTSDLTADSDGDGYTDG